MTTFDYGAALLIIAAVIGIVNERTLRLPHPVALLLGSMFVLSCLVLIDLAAGTSFCERRGARRASPDGVWKNCLEV